MAGFKADVRAGLGRVVPISLTANRAVSAVHRSAITTVDKLVVSTAALVSADVTTLGNLPHNTTVKSAYSPANIWGSCGLSAIGSVLLADDANDTHMADLTIPQVPGAGFYDVFLSTDAAPLWVARVTEAQRALGAKITAVGTVESPSAGVAAGKVRVDVIGTGIASNSVVFSQNNALVTSGIVGIDTVGYEFLMVNVYMYVADLRSAPNLSLAVLFEDDLGNKYLGDVITMPIMNGAVGQPLYQVFLLECMGATKTYILVNGIGGQDAQVTIRCERV
jgi:hypothetical protein